MAPLADIVRLARQYRAQVFVDECHATGFVGPTGRGTDEYWGVRGQVDIINSTLGKALGGATGERHVQCVLSECACDSCIVWVHSAVAG